MPKVLRKEQKKYDSLRDKQAKLQYDLDNVNAKIESARNKFSKEREELDQLKSNRP